MYRISKSLSQKEQAQAAGSSSELWSRTSSPQVRCLSLTLRKPGRVTMVHNQCHHLQTCDLPGYLSLLLVTPLDNCHQRHKVTFIYKHCFRLLWSIRISPQILIYSRLSDCFRRQNCMGSIQKTQTAVHPRVFCLVLFQKWSISKYLDPRFVPWSVNSEIGCLKHRWSLFPRLRNPGPWMDPNSLAILY